MHINRIIASLLVIVSSALQAEEKVIVYNWSEYIPSGVLEDFTQETGIKVEYSTYENNEELHHTLQQPNSPRYDVIVPSSYLVSRLRSENLLQPLDHNQLHNLRNLSISLMNKPYDPGNQYSVPYAWGSSGIAIDSSKIDPNSITRWADLWDSRWKNKLLLIDDVQDVFGMVLMQHGFKSSSSKPQEIKQAFNDLRALKPNIHAFNSEAPRKPLLTGEVPIAVIWNGEANMARHENPNIQYIYPQEGSVFWVDSFAIPKGAQHVDNAHRFIDYMLRAEVGKKFVQELGYSTPNGAARELLDESVRNDPTVFPPVSIIEQGEFQQDVGDTAAKLYQKYWNKLKKGT